MTKQDTDPTCGKGAVTTRIPFPSVVFSKIATSRDGIDSFVPGQLTRKAIAAQPEWLAQVPERVGDPAPGGRARALHGLRDVVPRRARMRARAQALEMARARA